MANERKAIGKSKRFSIFERDEFCCQYCGNRPPEVVLELDDIHPVSKGGDNDEINLVTSCFDCNQGKKARVLGDVAPRPDADLRYLRVQQEIAEAERYLAAKKHRDEVFQIIAEGLRDTWSEYLTPTLPEDRQFRIWLTICSPEEIDFAIRRCTRAYNSGQVTWVTELVRYVSGIMKREREQEVPRSA